MNTITLFEDEPLLKIKFDNVTLSTHTILITLFHVLHGLLIFIQLLLVSFPLSDKYNEAE